MAPGPPPVVHLPRLEGPAQEGFGCPAADAAATGSAGLPRPQAPPRSASQNPRQAPTSDPEGESRLPLQAPLFDRQAAGAFEPPRATRPGEDAQLPARVE